MSTRRPPRGRSADPRRIAYDVIAAVDESDAYANLLLPQRLSSAALSPEDAGLATELVYGTLRRRGYYDAVIEVAARRSLDAIAPAALRALRLGVHQLLGMRVPAHAAVDESVRLQRAVAGDRATGFVNGVLRAVARRDASAWERTIASALPEGPARLAVVESHPRWIVEAFAEALSAQGRGSELEDALAADNVAPRVAVCVLPGVGDPEDLPSDAQPVGVSPYGYALAGGDPSAVVERTRGAIRVQDPGSQAAALVLTRARPVRPGERWLDLCAGPGGKAALLGAEARAGGAVVVANEVVPARAGLVERSTEAVRDVVEVRVGDGREAASLGRFDRILLDAPCSGLGALRRRPEARWRKSESDLAELTALQGQLLDAALAALAPGGLLAYVTCSPHLAETRAAVDGILERADGELEELDAGAVLGGFAPTPPERAGAERSVQLWPHREGTDAMFIALLRRRDASAG